MYSAIVVLALCGYASAGVIGYAAPAIGILNTGASSQFRSQDNIGNYAFGYNEDHSTGGTFRREQGGPGVQVGSYGLRDLDGRTRVVNYVADAAGFRANIQTNEPGVDGSKDPAAVSINKAVVAPVAVAAPLVAHAAVAAPVAYASPLAASSYSVATNHVSSPIVSYAGLPAVSYAGVPAVSYAGHLGVPMSVSHYSSPVAAYSSKILAPGGYVSHW